jgi:hypothetical protein|tara:strand:+ start:716 stop:898 length:183 start_codon:yes stop_codon:yes gene_type:complete
MVNVYDGRSEDEGRGDRNRSRIGFYGDDNVDFYGALERISVVIKESNAEIIAREKLEGRE